MGEDTTITQGSALRERRRVILLCAPVTLLFTLADTLALQRFAPGVFGLRLAWAALIVAVALALGRVSVPVERGLMLTLAVASSLFFGLIAWLTGGFGSPLFHWILAMPLVIAVVLQEFPRATLGAALATLGSGVAIVLASGQTAAIAVQWAVQAFGMSALAVYASVTYRRLRFREQAMRESAAVALERAKATEHELKSRDMFLSIAAHELRTPLTALLLNVERLERAQQARDKNPGVEPATIENLHTQVLGLSTLVESLLDVSRLTAPKRPPLQLAHVDIASVVEQVVARYQSTAHKHGTTLHFERPAAPLIVALDRTRFDRVLTNLITNAIKYGARRPVEVTVTGRDGGVAVAVRDHGVGIAAADQERIFERFESGSAGAQAGLGLGLWIARRLTEELGGKLRVDSQPGEGACFTVTLPTVVAEAEPDERVSAS